MHASPLRVRALIALALVLAACGKSSEVPPAGAPAEAVPANSPVTTPAQGVPPAAPPPPAPAAEAPKSTDKDGLADDLNSLEDAEKALAQAQSELNRIAMLEPQKPATGRDEARPSKKAARAAAAPAPAAAGAGLGAPGGEAQSGSCDNVCRAYSSLLRAASAVCRIDGESGSHCAHAKQVRADAERRVASCSCPAP